MYDHFDKVPFLNIIDEIERANLRRERKKNSKSL